MVLGVWYGMQYLKKNRSKLLHVAFPSKPFSFSLLTKEARTDIANVNSGISSIFNDLHLIGAHEYQNAVASGWGWNLLVVEYKKPLIYTTIISEDIIFF